LERESLVLSCSIKDGGREEINLRNKFFIKNMFFCNKTKNVFMLSAIFYQNNILRKTHHKTLPVVLTIVVISLLLTYQPQVQPFLERSSLHGGVNRNTPDGLIFGRGWLEEDGEIQVIHLQGSYYEMGYQHGSLLKQEVQENVRAYISFSEKHGTSYDELLSIWNITKEYIPHEIIEEMQGIADGSELSFEMIAAANIIPIKYHCCGVAAWNDATVDGKLYHARSLDYPLDIRDPKTGRYLQENQIVIVREPNDGYASLYPAFAGFVGSVGGINENKIAIGQSSSWSSDETYHGIPMTFRVKLVLDHAASVEEAIDIILSNTTCGHNFIISDGKIPVGFAVETTANFSYVGTWNTSVEATHPCWIIDHVVRRTNFFVDPTTAATQRKRYDPSSFLLWLFHKNYYFPFWWHYRVLSREIEKHWGKLGLNSTMYMLRKVYLGRTDFFLFLARIIGFLHTMHQWVACPETGDILISFADVGKNAFEKPVYHFNLFRLLD